MIIQIHGMKNLTESERAQVARALKRGEAVLSSYIFLNKILAKRMSETRGMSNRQIYDLLISGADGQGTADGDIDIDIVGFWDASRTIGSTTIFGRIQRLNRRYLGLYTDAEIFGHVVHETMHRFGFYHRFLKTSSVPYVFGYAARDAFKEFYKAGTAPLFPSKHHVSFNIELV